MTELEKKLKRWEFLNELYNRGVESVSDQLKRNANDILLIRIEQELQRRKDSRDSKIESIIK